MLKKRVYQSVLVRQFNETTKQKKTESDSVLIATASIATIFPCPSYESRQLFFFSVLFCRASLGIENWNFVIFSLLHSHPLTPTLPLFVPALAGVTLALGVV